MRIAESIFTGRVETAILYGESDPHSLFGIMCMWSDEGDLYCSMVGCLRFISDMGSRSMYIP